MNVTVRRATADDYAALCGVYNAAYPEYPETPEEMRWGDENRPAHVKHERWLALQNGQAVGYGEWGHETGRFHPQKFTLDVIVLPQHRGEGIGGKLYDALLDAIAPLDPLSLSGYVRESEAGGLRFAARCGWEEVMREQESLLDLTTWNPEPWEPDARQVEESGVRLRSYAQLTGGLSGDALSSLHRHMDELHWALGQDIPHTGELTRVPFEEWVKRFDRPQFLPDGNWFAFDGDTLIGESILWGSAASPELGTGTTGVLRAYRGRGIATALKVRALTWAKASGAPAVRTFNEVNNRAMLGINRRLGFVPLPAWIEFQKALRASDEEAND